MTMLFDAAYYLGRNADVAVAVAQGTLTAEAHWEEYGAAEGRNPNAYFNTREYLAANPDVAASGMNPLIHFLTYGAAEGRAPSAAYADVAAAFDEADYLVANADVATAVESGDFASGYQHWVQFGQFEAQRPASPQVGGAQGQPAATVSGPTPAAEAVAALKAGATFADDATFADLLYGEDASNAIPFAGNGARAALDAAWQTIILKDGADISGLTLENVAGLVIEDAANVTMTTTQYTEFTSLNAGQRGTPGHETVTFSDGGTIDLSGTAVPYHYVEEYRLSDEGNIFTGPDNGALITGGAGDDTITGGAGDQIITGNAGADTLVYTAGQDGVDGIRGFHAAGALGAGSAQDTEEDVLQFAGTGEAAELARELREIRFVENGGVDSDVEGGDGPTVDMTLAFADGDSITFADLIGVGTDLSAFSASGRFVSDAAGAGDTTINAGETITLTGISGSELEGMFGASLTFVG